MKKEVTLLLLLCFFVAKFRSESLLGVTDYYWRDYDGSIPLDAFQANSKRCETPLYIGLGYFNGLGIITGLLRPGIMDVTISAYNKLYTTNKHIKILCGPHPELFHWMQTSTLTITALRKRCHLISGGSEEAQDNLIGKTTLYKDRTEIGKVFINNQPPVFAIPVSDNSRKEMGYDNFEVLAYNCASKEKCADVVP